MAPPAQQPATFNQAYVAAQFRMIWVQVQLSLMRLGALLVYIAMHWILGHVIETVVPQGWSRGKQALEGVFFLGFGLVYGLQVFEMITIFIPRLRILQARVLGEHNSA